MIFHCQWIGTLLHLEWTLLLHLLIDWCVFLKVVSSACEELLDTSGCGQLWCVAWLRQTGRCRLLLLLSCGFLLWVLILSEGAEGRDLLSLSTTHDGLGPRLKEMQSLARFLYIDRWQIKHKRKRHLQER